MLKVENEIITFLEERLNESTTSVDIELDEHFARSRAEAVIGDIITLRDYIKLRNINVSGNNSEKD